MQHEAGGGEVDGEPSRVQDDRDGPWLAQVSAGPAVATAGGSPEAFEAAFRASPVALALARDPHCAVVLRNPAMNRIFPASLDWRAWRLPDGSAPPLFAGDAALPLGEQPLRLAAFRGHATTGREIELRWAGREPVFLRVSAAPLFDAAGAPCGAVESAVDISAEKRTERARALRPGSDDVTGRFKDELLGSMGHDLRNPLNAIATAVEVLNRVEPLSPEALSARRIIGRQTRRLAELIGELSDIGRSLVERVDLVLRPLDLGALLELCIAGAAPSADRRRQRFEPDLDRVDVEGDTAQLATAFERLLEEATRSAPDGGVIGVRLRRTTGTDGSEGVVEIGDAEALGPRDGAAAAVRGDTVRRDLGLPLGAARHVVERHGGRIDRRRTDSPTGAGSVFVLRLPALGTAQAQASASIRRRAPV